MIGGGRGKGQGGSSQFGAQIVGPETSIRLGYPGQQNTPPNQNIINTNTQNNQNSQGAW